MATSGQITTSTGDSGSYQYVKWWRTGVNYTKPSSTIRWELWTHNAWNYYSNAIKNYGVTINGGSVYGGNTFSNINSGDHMLASGTGVEITQTSGQAKRFGCYTSGAFYVSDYVGYQEVSGGWDGETLDAIYKAATTNSATGNVIGDKFKVSYTNYGGYTYKLRISIPSVILLDRIDYNTSNAEFYLSTIAINKIKEKYPNASSVNLGFAIESYSGNTLIDSGNEVIVNNVTYKLPTISNLSHSNITRTGVTISFDSSSVITLNSKGVQISTDKISYIVNESMNISSSSIQVVNKLQANTKYYYRALATNNSGTTYSEWSEFTTTGNAPDIVSVTPDISVGSTTIGFSVNYDINASISSYKIEYGTTSSYGTTVNNSNILTTSSNNTLYYYKLTVTDSFNRSSIYSSTFTSGGNAPIINTSINYIRANKASFNFLPTYDTGASFNKLVTQYFYDGEVIKNKCNFNLDVLSNGVSWEFYGSELLLNGTSTADDFMINDNNTAYLTLPAGTYKISCRILSGSFQSLDTGIYFRNADNNTEYGSFLGERNYNENYSFTLNEDTRIKLIAYCSKQGMIFNNLRLGFQIEEGSTVTDYQEYGHTQVYNTEPSTIDLTNLKSNKYYTLNMYLIDNYNRTTSGDTYFKTPSGMKINNMIATEFKINGKLAIGMKLNGIVLYE